MMHKNFQSAISSFSEAIADDANDVNAYFRRGQSFFCLGNYAEAVRDFNHAAAKGAMDPNLYVWTGTAYASMCNDQLAIINYEKAMRLNPKLAGQPTAQHNEQVGLETKKDTTTSVKADNKSNASVSTISTTTTTATAATTSAAITASAATPAATTTSAATTTAASPATTTSSTTAPKTDLEVKKNSEILVKQAVTKSESAQANDSIEHKTAEANDSTEHKAAEANGSTEHKPAQTMTVGSSRNAVVDYQTAAKNVLANMTGTFIPGVVYSGIKNQTGGVVDLGELDAGSSASANKGDKVTESSLRTELRKLDDNINAQPQDAKLYFRRARVYLLSNKSTEGLGDLTRAIDLDKTNPHYYLARAFYYYQHDLTKDADADIRQAQEINPIIPGELSFELTDKNKTEKKL